MNSPFHYYDVIRAGFGYKQNRELLKASHFKASYYIILVRAVGWFEFTLVLGGGVHFCCKGNSLAGLKTGGSCPGGLQPSGCSAQYGNNSATSPALTIIKAHLLIPVHTKFYVCFTVIPSVSTKNLTNLPPAEASTAVISSCSYAKPCANTKDLT